MEVGSSARSQLSLHGRMDPLQVVLWALFVVALIGLPLTAAFYPDVALFVPVAIVALPVMLVLFRYSTLNLAVLLVAFIFAVNSRPGIQPTELAYGVYLITFLGHWYFTRWWAGERFVFSTLDRIAAVLVVGGGIMGIVVGLLMGASLDLLRGDVTTFLMFALYFPVKELCRTHRYGALIATGSIVAVGTYLAGYTYWHVNRIFQSATLGWQVADVRVGAVEAMILVACFGTLILIIHSTKLKHSIALGPVFLILLGALILTRGRAFWVALALGVFLLLILLSGRYRARFIALSLASAAGILVLVGLFFGHLADLVLSGTLHRMTLIAHGGQDISMLSRYAEWESAFRYIGTNPILGYGFGTTFLFYDPLYDATMERAFIHNGYIAAWYKLGIFGLLLWLAWWARGAWEGYVIYKQEGVPRWDRLCGLFVVVSLIPLALAANTSIFFLVMDQIFGFAVLTGIAAGLFQRHRDGPDLSIPAGDGG